MDHSQIVTHFQRKIILETQAERDYRYAHTPAPSFASFLHERKILVGTHVMYVEHGVEKSARSYQQEAALDFHTRLKGLPVERILEKGLDISRLYSDQGYNFTLKAQPRRDDPQTINLPRYVDGEEFGEITVKWGDFILVREDGTLGTLRVKECFMRKLRPNYKLRTNPKSATKIGGGGGAGGHAGGSTMKIGSIHQI